MAIVSLIVSLDSIINDAALRADQDGSRLSLVAVGFSNAEGGGMCVGVVNNDSILGVVNAGAAIVNDGIATTHAVHKDATGGGRCQGGCCPRSNL